jgi:hypothetical protein
MPNKIKSSSKLVLLLVPLLALTFVGCKKKHNDNIQSNGPDNLPWRLQLPKDGSPEAVRILQYAPDNFTRQVQESILKTGRYEGGSQLRFFRDDNSLKEIRTYWPADGDKPAQLGYDASFDSEGHYLAEISLSEDGVRQIDGHRQPDGTFEQNSFFGDGKNVYKHAILGQVMLKEPTLEWKPFSADVYREDKTLAATQQRMDDDGVFTQFFDAKHCLVETLHVDKPGTSTIETDYHPDCTTPLATYDFNNKTIWSFDEKGKISARRKWFADSSQQYTVYLAGVPLYTQDWEVDSSKSDKAATPPKIVLYLSWVKELRPDETVARETDFYNNSTTVEKIEVGDVAPKGAKFKPADGGPSLGSTTPAKNWTPPPPTPPTPTPTPTPTPAAATPAAGTPTPAAGTPTPAAGAKTPAAGAPTPAAGTPTPAAGAKTPAAGTPTPAAGAKTPAAGTPTPAAGAKTPAAGAKTPAAGAPTPAAGAKTPAAGAPGPAAAKPATGTPAPPNAVPAPPAPTLKPTLGPSLTPSFTPNLASSSGASTNGFNYRQIGLFGMFSFFFGGSGSTGSSTTTTTPVVTPFWTASSASTTYNYSTKGNLTSIEYTYTEPGKSEVTKTVKHQESEHIRAKVNANLVKALPAGNLPDKPKDLTPTAPSYEKIDYDYD